MSNESEGLTESLDVSAPETVDTTESESTAVDPLKTQALEKGWRDKDDWKGKPAQWKDYEAYLKDGDLFDRIKDQSSQIKHLKETLDVLVKYQQTDADARQDYAKTELKNKIKEAASVGDTEGTLKLADKLVQLEKSNTPTAPANDKQAQTLEATKQFVSKHPWIATPSPENMDMILYAREIDRTILTTRPDLSPAEHFKLVEDNLMYKFKDRLTVKPTSNSPKLASSDDAPLKSNSGSKKYKVDDFSAYHRNMIKTLQKQQGDKFDLQRYGKSCEELGAL